MQEYEGTWLNIDTDALEATLTDLGAEKVGEYHYRRSVYDYPDLSLDAQGAWIRLRDEGDKITLTFKKRVIGDTLGKDEGMIEHETEVSDFHTTAQILESAGFAEKFYMENKRIRWVLDGVELDFDTWPLLNTYLEIEAQSDEQVNAMAERLGLDVSEKLVCSATQIYEMNGIRDKDYKRLTFDECIKRDQ